MAWELGEGAGVPLLSVEDATLLGVYFMVAFDVFSSAHSSPYTAEVRGGNEINRARVMHWARIGGGIALGTGLIVTLATRKAWPAVGVAAGTTIMFGLYQHGLKRGSSDQEQQAG
jgi:hypothetical protein